MKNSFKFLLRRISGVVIQSRISLYAINRGESISQMMQEDNPDCLERSSTRKFVRAAFHRIRDSEGKIHYYQVFYDAARPLTGRKVTVLLYDDLCHCERILGIIDHQDKQIYFSNLLYLEELLERKYRYYYLMISSCGLMFVLAGPGYLRAVMLTILAALFLYIMIYVAIRIGVRILVLHILRASTPAGYRMTGYYLPRRHSY